MVFNSWVVLYCVNVSNFLYPFFYWGTSGFFPDFGYYKLGCFEHSRACVLITCWSIFWVYSQEWYCWNFQENYVNFSEEPPNWFPKCLYQLAFPTAMEECSSFSTFSPASAFIWVLILAILNSVRWNLRVVLIWISLWLRMLKLFLHASHTFSIPPLRILCLAVYTIFFFIFSYLYLKTGSPVLQAVHELIIHQRMSLYNWSPCLHFYRAGITDIYCHFGQYSVVNYSPCAESPTLI